jgi:hypothetical protein
VPEAHVKRDKERKEYLSEYRQGLKEYREDKKEYILILEVYI